MVLLGRERLEKLRGLGEQVQKWLLSWAAEITTANWKHAADVRDQFPNVQSSGQGSFVFPVADCGWKICLLIAYPQGVALITELKIEDEAHGS